MLLGGKLKWEVIMAYSLITNKIVWKFDLDISPQVWAFCLSRTEIRTCGKF